MNYDNYLPNVFFLSSGKSGTGTLYRYLKHCPNFSIQKQKELNFFAFAGFSQMDKFSDSVTSIENYVKALSDTEKEGELRFDVSPVNFYFHEQFCENIKDNYGDKINNLKYVFLLREPVSRAISHFNMNLDVWDFRDIVSALNDTSYSNLSFSQKISMSSDGGYNYFYDYIGASLYSERISYILQNLNIDKDRFCIVKFDEFINSPVSVLKDICSFLEIEDNWVEDLPIYQTGSNGSLRLGWLYRFLVKPNQFKDNLKRLPLFSNSMFRNLKARIYSSSVFRGSVKTIDRDLHNQLLKSFFTQISSLLRNFMALICLHGKN